MWPACYTVAVWALARYDLPVVLSETGNSRLLGIYHLGWQATWCLLGQSWGQAVNMRVAMLLCLSLVGTSVDVKILQRWSSGRSEVFQTTASSLNP